METVLQGWRPRSAAGSRARNAAAWHRERRLIRMNAVFSYDTELVPFGSGFLHRLFLEPFYLRISKCYGKTGEETSPCRTQPSKALK